MSNRPIDLRSDTVTRPTAEMRAAMRQVGVLAAAGLVALEKMPARLGEDHDNAGLLADLLAELPGLTLEPARVRTNIIVVGIERTGFSSDVLQESLAGEGVRIGTIDRRTIRLLTHFDVSTAEVRQAAAAFRGVLERRSARVHA